MTIVYDDGKGVARDVFSGRSITDPTIPESATPKNSHSAGEKTTANEPGRLSVQFHPFNRIGWFDIH
jgi:hypothetical protein